MDIYMQKNINPYLSPHIKINPKCIIDPNVKSKTINHLEENTGENLYDLRLGQDFLDMTPKAKSIKRTLDFIRLGRRQMDLYSF